MPQAPPTRRRWFWFGMWMVLLSSKLLLHVTSGEPQRALAAAEEFESPPRGSHGAD